MRKNLLWLVIFSLPLAACSGSSPETVAQQYLEAIQAGDRATAEALFCYPEGYNMADIHGVRAFTITNTEESELQGLPLYLIDFDFEQGAGRGFVGAGEIEVVPKGKKFHEANSAGFAALGMEPPDVDADEIPAGTCIVRVVQTEDLSIPVAP
jgi:hypothetical protein